MPLTLLLDLDDTLLDTNVDVFTPAYFQALIKHLDGRVNPDLMLGALLRGMGLMNVSEDPTRTLKEVFDASFYPELGVAREDLEEVLDDFYDNVLPQLESHTKRRPEAAPFVAWAESQGFRVAIATDPLLPRKATHHRVRWAGIDPDTVELITTFETFHFSKTHPAYYAEVLGRLGWPEGPVLMVGNDIERDLLPAHRLGLPTYLIDGDDTSAPEFAAGRGRLADLRPWLESVNLSTLEPAYKTREAILAIMTSTPAVLRSLTSCLTDEQWRHEPTRDDWALNEIACHLRDTEREIHQLQVRRLMEREGAFLPRPENAIWANEREYLNVHGPSALAEFAEARLAVLGTLKEQNGEIWSRKARHAIFGPTSFLEVVGFIANHDRLHIQQAWKTMQSLTNVRV
jgi:FMN phosphatase YigB (HAD superfamily)